MEFTVKKFFSLIVCVNAVFFGDLFAVSESVSSEMLKDIPPYLRPISSEEYIEPCKKFSVSFSSISESKDMPKVITDEVDPNNILIMTPKSIIKGVFKEIKKEERINGFLELLNSEEKLREEFKKFVDSTHVSEDDVLGSVSFERANRYRDFVFETITAGFGVKAYRGRIASFLSALEYRKKINPKFKVQFNIIDKIEERIVDENLLLLGFEYKDGRHYSDLGRRSVRLTIPFSFTEDSASDNIYTCMHEMGHAVHSLLGIESRRIPLSVSSENAWMRKAFFPLLERVEIVMPYFVNRAKESIKGGIYLGKSMFDCFSYKLYGVKGTYKDERQPYDENEFYRMGITQIENMLSDKRIAGILKDSDNVDDIDQRLLEMQVRLMAKYASFYNLWINAEEMFQIAGVASIGDYIVIDRNSDLSALYEQNKAVRWGHSIYSFVPEQGGKEFEMTKMLIPEDKYVESLFNLHGLDFRSYKQKITVKRKDT